MAHTLVIAGTLEAASSVAKWYALREIPVDWLTPAQLSGSGTVGFEGYRFTSASGAVHHLRGANYQRIIIGFDWMLPGNPYVHWRLPLGGWDELVSAIDVAVARGAKRVWA